MAPKRCVFLPGVHQLDRGHSGLDLRESGVGAAHETDAADPSLPGLNLRTGQDRTGAKDDIYIYRRRVNVYRRIYTRERLSAAGTPVPNGIPSMHYTTYHYHTQ